MSSNQSLICKIKDDVNLFRFVKGLVECKHFGDDFSISNLIKCVKIANKRLLQNNN